MKIILPNNGFGAAIMVTAVTLVVTIPFVLTLWLSLKVAPLWVAAPVATAASFVMVLLTVKFRK